MTDVSSDTLLEAVTEAATIAGRTALAHFKRGVQVETKADGSPVTIADVSAERAVREWLERRFPNDAVLGEELGDTAGTGRRWLIDPIDGTKSFVRGVPLWGSMVAVAEGSEVLAGAIFCPAADDLVAAANGLGCYWNGSRCQVSSCDRLSEATMLATSQNFRYNPARAVPWATLASQVAVARSWGDCYGYVLVATGRAELMADDRLSPWDLAALIPIIAEAGGVLTDWEGRSSLDATDAVATNALLAGEFRRILGVPVAR